MKIFKLGSSCNCDFCKKFHLKKMKELKKCGCSCHKGLLISSHDSLCCSMPNAKIDYIKMPNKKGEI